MRASSRERFEASIAARDTSIEERSSAVRFASVAASALASSALRDDASSSATRTMSRPALSRSVCVTLKTPGGINTSCSSGFAEIFEMSWPFNAVIVMMVAWRGSISRSSGKRLRNSGLYAPWATTRQCCGSSLPRRNGARAKHGL